MRVQGAVSPLSRLPAVVSKKSESARATRDRETR